MSILGKYVVVKVLSKFDDNLKPVYVSKEEALTLDEYKDAKSNAFINSTYILKKDSFEIVLKVKDDNMRNEAKKANVKFIDEDTIIYQGMKAVIENGKYYVFDEKNPDDKAEITQNEDGTLSFMMLLILKKLD